MSSLATTKMSSKGQVVIPEEIRQRLGLAAGTRFLVLAEDDVVVLKTVSMPSSETFQALVRQAREAAAQAGMTESDIAEAIRSSRTSQ
jgi:AbrB family looped-hinge helix DNA binding protein